MAKSRKSTLKYRKMHTARRTMDNLCTMRKELQAMPDSPFKRMMLELLDDYGPNARPFQERIRGG